MIQEWKANTGKEETLPDSAILEFYNHFIHGNPDEGVNMLDVMKFRRKSSFGRDKIFAFAKVD